MKTECWKQERVKEATKDNGCTNGVIYLVFITKESKNK